MSGPEPVILDGGMSNALEELGQDLSDPMWTAGVLRDAIEAARESLRTGIDVDLDRAGMATTLTALVTFGEGYHSFHHRFPFDYRNGARWWQYDPSKWLIWTLSRLRLVSKPRMASPATVARAVSGAGASPPAGR